MSAISQMLLACGAAPRVYTTWNPSDKNADITLSNGNLTAHAAGAAIGNVRSIASKAAGKWYFEFTQSAPSYESGLIVGVANSSEASWPGGAGGNSLSYMGAGVIKFNNTTLASVTAYTYGNVIGVAFDRDAGTVSFYLNNTLLYTASGANVPSGSLFAIFGDLSSAVGVIANFGASSLTYAPPSGFNSGLYT